MERDIESKLAEISSSLSRVETALLGDAAIGHTGIVERIDRLEGIVEVHERRFIKWSGIVATIIIMLQLLMHQVLKFVGAN